MLKSRFINEALDADTTIKSAPTVGTTARRPGYAVLLSNSITAMTIRVNPTRDVRFGSIAGTRACERQAIGITAPARNCHALVGARKKAADSSKGVR